MDAKTIGVSIDETTSVADIDALFKVSQEVNGMSLDHILFYYCHYSCLASHCYLMTSLNLIQVLNGGKVAPFTAESLTPSVKAGVGAFARSTKFLEAPVFNMYHDEHSMLR